jgi:hypothetical protein
MPPSGLKAIMHLKASEARDNLIHRKIWTKCKITTKNNCNGS